MRLHAPAKLNLCLYLGPSRADGLHALCSLFEPLALADLIRIEEADRETLRGYGFTDRDIWDIGAVAAFFNMSNRVAAAVDMRPNAEYHAMAR